MQQFYNIVDKLNKETNWFNNYVQEGYIHIMPLEYQQTSINSIPGLYDNQGNMELSEHVAVARELLYQLQDIIQIPNTHLELSSGKNGANIFLTLKNTVHNATIRVFGQSSFEQLYDYALNYIFEGEHEWDHLRKEEYYSNDKKNMIDKGINGLFLLSKEFNIDIKGTCEGHPHGAYICFLNTNNNSLKLNDTLENIPFWKKMSSSSNLLNFKMDNVDEEQRREMWRQTWDILKKEFQYELPDDIDNRINVTNIFKI
jgi:hypothetical protein